jgi:DNA-binding NarL/FixJ family response regulator
VIIVDAQAAVREALVLLLRTWDFDVQPGTGDPARAAERIRAMRPAVALLELDLARRGDGAALARQLLADGSDARILLFTAATDEYVLRNAVRIGAPGLLTKAAGAQELREALEAVAAGRSYLDHRLSNLAVNIASRAGQLSDREREILTLLAAGSTGEGIADRLVLSPETVRTHVRNAMEKLGARTRSHAVVLAIGRGEIRRP